MLPHSEPEPRDYDILATSSRADERTRVVKHGDSFAVFDPSGAIRREGLGELGIYHDGTRFLSRFELALARRRPMLLGSTVRPDGVLVVDLANPDIPEFAGGLLVRDTVHVSATSCLWGGGWYVRYTVHNYGQRAIELELALMFGADYVDVFEVRGMTRERRGTGRVPVIERDSVLLGYDGLDGRARTTRLVFSHVPKRLTASHAELVLRLDAGASYSFDVRAAFGVDGAPRLLEVDEALERVLGESHRRSGQRAAVASSNERFDAWLERSCSDLDMMVTNTTHGPYPYAGVPWFSTPFGRDGIITAYEVLWRDPALARGALSFLAATQATAHDPARDAEPGKIVHELRLGEMASLGEIPFGRYYGSVDATPLFVVLAGDYWRRTGDVETVHALWPNVARALRWIEADGDLDGDGFVEYAPKTSRGLVTQGWKDSHDSISHADGALAEGPIALCEVQGYVYAAKRAGAELARVMGLAEEARRLECDAEELRERFERAFWCEGLGTYALALDRHKRPCEVRSSNAGHLLWSGIVTRERAARVVAQLFSAGSFSGWGIRTLDASAARFNPISYHNGSVWPHDNALIAAGLARYGFKRECGRLLRGLFEATHHFDLGRMPELFCGFTRRSTEGPTLYPVACAPQAWAAGAAFLLLQSCLGLQIDAPARRVLLERPHLPAALHKVTIRDLRVAGARVDLVCRAHGDEVSVQLERREGDLELAVIQ